MMNSARVGRRRVRLFRRYMPTAQIAARSAVGSTGGARTDPGIYPPGGTAGKKLAVQVGGLAPNPNPRHHEGLWQKFQDGSIAPWRHPPSGPAKSRPLETIPPRAPYVEVDQRSPNRSATFKARRRRLAEDLTRGKIFLSSSGAVGVRQGRHCCAWLGRGFETPVSRGAFSIDGEDMTGRSPPMKRPVNIDVSSHTRCFRT